MNDGVLLLFFSQFHILQTYSWNRMVNVAIDLIFLKPVMFDNKGAWRLPVCLVNTKLPEGHRRQGYIVLGTCRG